MGNRLLFTILIIGILAVAGTWVLVHRAADHMLEAQARSESLGWAEFVRRDIVDLDHILRGAPPTFNDIQTLSTAKNVGNIFWFKIYDHDSTVVWSADFNQVGDENTSAAFKEYVTKGEEYVAFSYLEGQDRSVIAHAFLPIMDGKSFKGAIEVSLDLSKTAQANHDMIFYVISTIASLFLILLLIASLFVRKEIKHQRTLRKAAEKAAKARNDFVAMVSHELRTPLNGILGALGLLSETTQTDTQVQLTRTTTHSAEHLLAIINDILDFTQLSGQRTTLTPCIVNMEELADEINVMFKTDALTKHITFDIEKCFRKDATGEIDLQRLRQIIFNLTSNAFKFTSEGSIILNFDIKDVAQKRQLICSVSDTGIGMTDQDQKQVFQRFHQVGDTLSRQHGGIGLGLSVCKELAQLMGGELTLSSCLGEGSIFTLKVPFPESKIEAIEESTSSTQTHTPHKSLHILLAEDNAINQKVIKATLETAEHCVTVAVNGLDAVEQAAHQKFDLILMDIQMPELDGVEATKRIRQETGINQETPIIALSANILHDQQASFLKAGMQACLTKPIKPIDLRHYVLAFYQQFVNEKKNDIKTD